MEFIYTDQNGVVTFDRYFAYVESIREHLAPELYAFAADPERYDLRSTRSLHDAWLEGLHVVNDVVDESGKTTVRLHLLGPYHDRRHTLEYLAVVRVDIEGASSSPTLSSSMSRKDLLFHEVRWKHGLIEHEIEFDGGMRIRIACTDMRHAESAVSGGAVT